ncbi:AMP-binding protein [Amycolatopsis sp. NPDC023774]|uniref:AMP-binding protein n=1 Tax=Amycolatopsis sp. NPDC023774 TaxID=3155015 RepID=UPI0033E05BA0
MRAGATAGNLKTIVEETGVKVFGASSEHFGTTVDLVASPSVLRLVAFDCTTELDGHRDSVAAAKARLSEAGSDVVLNVLPVVAERDSALPAAPLDTADPADADPLAMLSYTSGSTGTPKGATHSERVSLELWREFMPGRENRALVLGFQPSRHVVGQSVTASALGCGGTVHLLGKSDLSAVLA